MIRILLPLLLLLAGLFLLSVGVGPALPAGPSIRTLFAFVGGAPVDPAVAIVVQEIRLPRAVLGVVVGASLGVAGACLQGLLRNPLAEPGLVGASSMAALGAVSMIYFGVFASAPLALPAAGIAGALLAVGLMYLLAGRDAGPLTLILAGVAINTLGGALTSLLLNLAPNPHAALEIAFWLLGSLADRSRDHVRVALPFALAGLALLLSAARGLDALTLGERTAHTLGTSVRFLHLRIIVGTALAVGASVAVTGSVAFIGLMVPHLVRPLAGHRPGAALLPSAVAGACLLLAADVGVRLLPTNEELKLGVVTGLLGVPFFLAILFRTRREAL
ncbi:MAG TPA: iron ABC transporter permease [Azospirillaceae bacterium]|nr:iron ABC transporter permease [Azospirillaceae bacterium]